MSENLIVMVAVMAGLGLIFGSFIAAVSVRLPRDMDVVSQRSRCMSCEQPLRPWHLVPVVSWLVLRGRCGHCREPISWRYPAIEAGAALLGAWAAWHSHQVGGGWIMAGVGAVLAWQLLLIALIDGEHFWLPDILTWPLAITGLAAAALFQRELLLAHVIGAAGGFGLLWLIGWGYKRLRGREGLGGGDPFLMAGAGAWVGWVGLPSVLLWACAAGFSVVLARLIVRREISGQDRLPFGVFLAAGIWLVWLYGPLGL